MGQLMLINPKKRSTRRKKARSPAQRAATKKMLAANRARRSSRKTSRRKSNPVGLSRVARRTVRRSRRRNPARALGGIGSNITGMAMPAIQGAGGALLINTALNYLPLPAMLKSGNGKYLARAGLAIAVGTFGSKLLPGRVASNMAVGALTVALHDLMLGIASRAMPTLQLGDVGDYDDGVAAYVDQPQMLGYEEMAGMGDVYEQSGVGEYVHA